MLAKEERANVLGISELQSRFFDLPDFLDEKQKQILSWYLPYQKQIQGDLRLTQDCFFSMIGKPVQLILEAPKIKKLAGASINNWIIGSSQVVGGYQESDKPLLIIKIGPIPIKDLADFVAGGRWRRFFEEVIYPNFLSQKWDWETQILVETQQNQFKVSNEAFELRIGINSYV